MAATIEVNEVGKTIEEQSVCEKREREDESKTLTPWEQHATIISIPRFDYAAPSSLLRHSHSGFLVTCTIKREKSATKELMSILGKVLAISEEQAEALKSSDASKKRKLCSPDVDQDEGKIIPLEKDVLQELGENSNVEDLKSDKESIDEEHNPIMSLVKLTKSGLLLYTFPVEKSLNTTNIVSQIFQFMESGALKAPM